MDLDMIIEKRRSVRSYTSFVPSDRDIEKLVVAAGAAPSAGNLKARKTFVIRSRSKKMQDIIEVLHQEWVSEAPFLLLFCADTKAIEKYGDRGRDLYCIQDASIAATFAMLRATDIGLATCWVGAFDEEGISKAFGLPSHLRPVSILVVGYEK